MEFLYLTLFPEINNHFNNPLLPLSTKSSKFIMQLSCKKGELVPLYPKAPYNR